MFLYLLASMMVSGLTSDYLFGINHGMSWQTFLISVLTGVGAGAVTGQFEKAMKGKL